MSAFPLFDTDDAPPDSKAMLEQANRSMGMVPNLLKVMAASPQLLEGYRTLHELFTNSSLTPIEQNVVWLTINVEHRCYYCVPAHTGIAKQMKVPDEIIEALRAEQPLADSKLETLRQFTLEMVRNRGHVSEQVLQEFLDAGYTGRQVMDIILGLSQKVMSNYLNHLADTPTDAAFSQFQWRK